METKKYTLPKEFGMKWIEALRSGDYVQGRKQLHDHGTYCCLGVCCKLVGFEDFGESQYIQTGTAYYNLKQIPNGIPIQLIGTVGNNNLIQDLVRLNDDEECSFSEIADWLETNIEMI